METREWLLPSASLKQVPEAAKGGCSLGSLSKFGQLKEAEEHETRE
jgi:hypothetical protein